MVDLMWIKRLPLLKCCDRQKVLPDEDVTPFKSFIHSECITSPEHPFYNASLGGVELFVGRLWPIPVGNRTLKH